MNTELHIIRLTFNGMVHTTAVKFLDEVSAEVKRITGNPRYPADVFRWVLYGDWKMKRHIAWPI